MRRPRGRARAIRRTPGVRVQRNGARSSQAAAASAGHVAFEGREWWGSRRLAVEEAGDAGSGRPPPARERGEGGWALGWSGVMLLPKASTLGRQTGQIPCNYVGFVNYG